MPLARALTAVVVATVLSVGLASPAWGEDFSGTYSLTLIGATGGNAQWTASTTCAPSGGCVAHVISSTGWSADAQLDGGRWTMTVNRRDGQSCPDGSRHSEAQTWSWDAGTLSGTVSGVSFDPIACPQGPPDSFNLTKVHSGGATYTANVIGSSAWSLN